MACIEVIMHLEEQNLEVITENSELLVACFFIIESAVSYLSNPESQLGGILKQRRNIQQALNNAFAAILKFLHELSKLQKDLLQKIKHFVCATIRILGAWLSEETQALRDEVYDIIPFIYQLATETFEVQKSAKLAALPGRSTDEFTSESALTSLQNKGSQATTPDTLRFLVPAMCHLVAEDKPRKIILDMKMHETLFTYLSYHWAIFDSFRQWLKAQVILTQFVRNSEIQKNSAKLQCFNFTLFISREKSLDLTQNPPTKSEGFFTLPFNSQNIQ